MPKVKVNDIEMYYEKLGQGNPLLLIRGWGSSSQSWSKLFLEGLSKHYKLIIFDNRGTGRTDKSDTKYSIEQMADDTAGLLDALNIPRAHVVGFSMGGMIAQQFAIKYPEKTTGLVIACSHPSVHVASRSNEVLETMEMMIVPPEDISPKELQKRVISLISTPEYIAKHGDMLLNAQQSANTIPTPGYVRRRQFDAIQEFSSLEKLPLIKAPTLVMHGEKDAWVPVENSKVIADLIPCSRLVLFDESGHGFIEQRSEMIDAILDFLKEVDS